MPSSSNWTTLLLFGAMAVAFYFLMIRPQRRRQRQQREALAALEPGSRVLLGSGFYATLIEMRDTEADVEIAPGTVVTVVRQAIMPQAPNAAPLSASGDAQDTEADRAAANNELDPLPEAPEAPGDESIRPDSYEPGAGDDRRPDQR